MPIGNQIMPLCRVLRPFRYLDGAGQAVWITPENNPEYPLPTHAAQAQEALFNVEILSDEHQRPAKKKAQKKELK